jgi:threonine/homoserine efflux transporter RhtA
MSEKTITALVTIALAVVGVAVIATLVSSKAQTGSVFGALGNAFSGTLCKALSPITGSSCGGVANVTSTISYG